MKAKTTLLVLWIFTSNFSPHFAEFVTNRFVSEIHPIWKDLLIMLDSANVHPQLKKNQRKKANFKCATNNIHEKISPCSLAESMSINPKQCKNFKFFECRKTKLVQKVEIECKNLKLN